MRLLYNLYVEIYNFCIDRWNRWIARRTRNETDVEIRLHNYQTDNYNKEVDEWNATK